MIQCPAHHATIRDPDKGSLEPTPAAALFSPREPGQVKRAPTAPPAAPREDGRWLVLSRSRTPHHRPPARISVRLDPLAPTRRPWPDEPARPGCSGMSREAGREACRRRHVTDLQDQSAHARALRNLRATGMPAGTRLVRPVALGAMEAGQPRSENIAGRG